MEMTRNNIKIDPILEINTDWNPPCISAISKHGLMWTRNSAPTPMSTRICG